MEVNREKLTMSYCISCQKLIPGGYAELAKHIISSKAGHRRGKKWAASVMCQTRRLDRRATLLSRPGRIALTEEQKETKKSLVREVSGRFQKVIAWCPKGKHNHSMAVEVEYLESLDAWKLGDEPVILCEGCR